MTGSPKNKVILVFDGYPGPEEDAGLNTDAAVDVIFSKNMTADERIREMIEHAVNKKNIVVVSDDKEIRFFAKAYGAKPLCVEDFIADRKKSRKKEEDSWDAKLGFTQMHKINEEFRRIWLEQ